MTELLADLILSGMVLVAVTVLALAGAVDGELVAFALGGVLPSPTRAAAQHLTARRAPGG